MRSRRKARKSCRLRAKGDEDPVVLGGVEGEGLNVAPAGFAAQGKVFDPDQLKVGDGPTAAG